MEDQKKQLEQEVERLKKINKALMGRVERSVAGSQNAFSLFEGNILLSNQVKKRTQELQTLTEVLDQEKEKIIRILKSLPGAILIFDDNCKVLEFYPNRVGMDVLSKVFSSTKNEFCSPFIFSLKKYLKKLEGGQRVSSFNYLDSLAGEDLFLDCSVTEIVDSMNMLFITNGTEKFLQEKLIKEQEAHLLQAAKLSSLGEMAGGVAHEINTPLGTIMMLVSRINTLAKKDRLDVEKVLVTAERVKKTVTQIAKIVQSLRQISRDGDGDDFEEVGVLEVLDDSLELCQQKFKMKSVDLIVEKEAAEGLRIKARKVQLSQVFLNLLNNAYQAVEGSEKPWVKIQFLQTEERVKISVIDSGKGIDQSIVDKVFDPFFTTKKIGEGTGLGMSISRRIVEDHDGILGYELYNGNTSFYIDLKRDKKEEIKAA